MVHYSVLLAKTNVFVGLGERHQISPSHLSGWNRLVRGSCFFVRKVTFQNIQRIFPAFHNIKFTTHKYQSHGIGATTPGGSSLYTSAREAGQMKKDFCIGDRFKCSVEYITLCL
jgi:hypothetical protein